MFFGNPLSLVRRQWERNARLDPYWTILARPECRHGRWDRDAFFASGRGDVDRVLTRLAEAGVSPRRPGAVLDFGCGVGRLTWALGATFGSAVGVDVSERMIDLAQQLHAGAPGLRFVHNHRPDLACFPSASFDFVCSLITLQHLPPALARSYLAEFVRVCRPGGLAVVQIVTGKRTRGKWFWPPTVARWAWRGLNRQLALTPVMEMFPLPEQEVGQIVQAGGAEVVGVWPDQSAGAQFESRLLAIRLRATAAVAA